MSLLSVFWPVPYSRCSFYGDLLCKPLILFFEFSLFKIIYFIIFFAFRTLIIGEFIYYFGAPHSLVIFKSTPEFLLVEHAAFLYILYERVHFLNRAVVSDELHTFIVQFSWYYVVLSFKYFRICNNLFQALHIKCIYFLSFLSCCGVYKVYYVCRWMCLCVCVAK